MAHSKLVLPVPPHLVPSHFETHFATELMLQPNVRVEDFCREFQAMACNGIGRIVNGTIIVHTDQLGLKHVSTDNIERVKKMYTAVFKKLKESVHSSIIIAPNAFVQGAIKVVMRASGGTPATEVTVVRTHQEALTKALEIAKEIHEPALRKRVHQSAVKMDVRALVLVSLALYTICLQSHTLPSAMA